MSLASAFQQGDKEAVKCLLPRTCTKDTCLDANIRTGFSSSLICASDVSLVHLAAYHGWLDVIDNLIRYGRRNAHCIASRARYGCNAHCIDSRGRSSLHYAACKGHLRVVKYLINEYNCHPSFVG